MTGSGDGETAPTYVFGYRTPVGRLQSWVFLVGFGGATVWILGATALGTGPPLLFVAAWVATILWLGYWLVWAGGCEIEIADGRVRWRSFLRRREVALDDVMGNSSVLMQFARLEVRGDRPLLMNIGAGWPTFLAALATALPGRPFDATWAQDLADRWVVSFGGGFYDEVR